MKHVALLMIGLGVAFASASRAADPALLVLETKIPLGEIKGRIDHFAVDLERERLFVSELGNDSVGVVDLKQRKVIRTLTGFSEPQGVAYVRSTDTLYVSNAGDGSVHLFQGPELSPVGRIELGEDADNLRVDPRRSTVWVGYGSGGLAAIDPASRAKVADVPLKAHPESFQFAESGTRIFVNLPDARQIALVDVASGKQTSILSPDGARANFPMAVDDDEHRMLSIFRSPPKLMVFGSRDGKRVASLDTCGDADDVFVDSKRHRVYVSCGEGVIDVFASGNNGYEHVARVPTVAGARTSLLVPEIDRLYVAVRAASGEAAAVWVFRPTP